MGKFTFRTGKYKGKTLNWVEDNDPRYLVWIEENRPEMLKEKKTSEVKVNIHHRYKPLTPNMDFDNEVSEDITNKTKRDDEDGKPK